MDSQQKLNARQLKFVDAYTTGMSLAAAYRSAGYKPRSDYDANKKARKLSEDPRIKAEVDRRLDEITAKAWKRLKEEGVPRARAILKAAKANSIQKRAARDILRRAGESLK